jgi:nitrite transporter
MPLSVPDALADQQMKSVLKARQVYDWPRYVFLTLLAGAYIGVAVVLLASVAGPLVAADSPEAKLVSGAIFGVGLTLVVFAGAELFTGNTMVMLQGWRAGLVRPVDVVLVCAVSLVGNVVGSFLFAAVVHAAGSVTGPAAELISSIAAHKDAAAGPQLFWRAVLCNALVCLAMWMAARANSDSAKLVVMWWALLAFVASGFEHSIANATTFSLAALDGSIGWGALARNLAWTVPGNIVGGGIVVGLGYAWLAQGPLAHGSLDPATATPELAEIS